MAAWAELSASGATAGAARRIEMVWGRCEDTESWNTSVLPKWLRRGTPTISGHPVIMGLLGFQRVTHKNRAGVNSCKKCLHSEKLRSGGGKTGTRRAISERSSVISWWTSWAGMPRRVESWFLIMANGLGTKMPLDKSRIFLDRGDSVAVLRKIQSTGTSKSFTKSLMMP
ncbi:hypothetical protein CRG98_016468 [Punica granatum]|uniref:Uncharacterized protein n=1 Tax=Punica granatum TaxID=22663 RepID=A0A2I0K619_PUNGR|nr:hypothetical protein CRG98_016468 [Punica granatum]